MKKIASIIMAAATLFAACTPDEGGKTQGGTTANIKADFTISVNPATVGEEVTFTATASGGIEPYTYSWELGSDIKVEGNPLNYTFEQNNAYIVKLTVTDKDGNKAEKRKNLVVNPAEVAETGEVTLLWAAKMRGYNTVSTPAVTDDGCVVAVSGNNEIDGKAGQVAKFDKDGKVVWTRDLPGKAKGTPSIDADGTIFLPNGSANGTAVVYALNPADGTSKWEFTSDKFWAAPGQTPAPSLQGGICGIGANNIYFGNCGTTGSVLAVNKATGERVGWVTNADGTGGPAGGVRSGVVITKSGQIVWGGGQYGTHYIAQSALDGAGNSGVPYAGRYYPVQAKNNSEGGIAALTIGGKSCIAGMATNKDTVLPWIYVFDAATGAAVCEYNLAEGNAEMDNGAVVVTAEGYIVATLNFTNGQENGGIIIINPSSATGTLVAECRLQEKVSGSPAIDAAGNIHFGTESGNYYMVSKTCEVLAKKNLAELVASDSRYSADMPFEAAKVYSSVVLGDDGKVFVHFTNNDANKKREWSAVVCLEVGGCTGVGDTPWPMFGQNRRHTNCEK